MRVLLAVNDSLPNRWFEERYFLRPMSMGQEIIVSQVGHAGFCLIHINIHYRINSMFRKWPSKYKLYRSKMRNHGGKQSVDLTVFDLSQTQPPIYINLKILPKCTL
jgi:hypothetical protein